MIIFKKHGKWLIKHNHVNPEQLNVGKGFSASSFLFIRGYFQTLVRFLAEASISQVSSCEPLWKTVFFAKQAIVALSCKCLKRSEVTKAHRYSHQTRRLKPYKVA